MKGKRGTSGITLVALVVTIVVLLILAGITLVYVFGDNGIIKLAQEAKNRTEEGMQNEQEEMGNLVNWLKEEYGSGESGGGTTNPPDQPEPPVKLKNISEIVGEKQDETITVEDANKNKITVPAGFKIVPDSGEKPADSTETDEVWNAKKVVYSYLGDEAKTPTVQDGIVIEDATGTATNGNQFVWIPVGEINNKDNTKTTITLGRYADFVKKDINGNYTPLQPAYTVEKPQNYEEEITIDTYFQELLEDSENIAAEDLSAFVSVTKAHGGYYLARYEASGGSGDNTTDKAKTQANQTVWTSMKQSTAATNARNMYSGNLYVRSDLVNSYAWDTAIIFIQQYSEGNESYSSSKTVNASVLNIQKTGNLGDRVCNIHDLASNCLEWSTEHSSHNSMTSCKRGGSNYFLYVDTTVAAGRSTEDATKKSEAFSFRPVLYLKNNTAE